MARIKRSPEAQVLAYFREVNLESAELVFGLIRDIMRGRSRPKPKPAKAPKPAPGTFPSVT